MIEDILRLLETANEVLNEPVVPNETYTDEVRDLSLAGQSMLIFERLEKVAEIGKEMSKKFVAATIPHQFDEGPIGNVYVKRTSRKTFDNDAWKFVVAKPDHEAYPANEALKAAKEELKRYTDAARNDPDFSGIDWSVSVRALEPGDV